MEKVIDETTKPDRSRPGLSTAAPPTAAFQGGGDKSATGSRPEIRMQSEETTIGTWNIRTLNSGRIHELTHELERYKWDIIGLCEVRWKNFGETVTKEGHKLWYSGDESKHQHGVGILVNKNKIDSVISCTPISSRLMSIRIAAKPQNITIFQVYAPTTDYSDETVEEFYEELEEAIKKIPKKNFLIIQGDWNAKVGTDAYSHWSGTVGQFGVGDTNDRGIRLLEFARSHKLTIANTLYPHKMSRRTTWHSPNGEIHNQIDYILTPCRFKSSINKAQTRSFPGADVGSDHDLVLTSIRLKLKSKKKEKSPRIRFDLEKLKDPDILKIFQAKIGGRFAALNFVHEDIDSITESFNSAVEEIASEVLGKPRKKKKPWITDEILDLCDKRRELKPKRFDSDENKTNYSKINRTIRKEMAKAEEQWIVEQCETIESEFKKGNSKEAYDTIKKITKIEQPRTSVIEDKEGNVITESSAVLDRWTEYCRELYNHKLNVNKEDLGETNKRENNPIETQILRDEVEEAVKKMKNGKSPGVDNIPGELIKNGGKAMIDALTVICQRIWTTKEWPNKWTQSIMIPLPKKGNLKKCQNYRTISLISHASKVMLRIIMNRLKTKAEEILSEEQAGFRPGRSTVEQIFNIRILIEKHRDHQESIYHNFIDFKKAFDRVWHDGLWKVMRDYNFDEDLIQVIEALYNNAASAVLLGDTIGDFFHTTVGVRQGCILSPILFNIFLENIMQEALQDHSTTISIGGRQICNLRFADDIDLMGKTEKELQELTSKLDNSASKYGMEISAEKSKILVNSTLPTVPTNISMNGEILEEVDSFKYLGAIINKEGTSLQEVKTRLAIALAAMTKLSKIWQSNKIQISSKVKLYKTLVTSIALYGCESWTLNSESERRIQAFEMKCLRRILGISYRERKTNEHVWNQIMNHVNDIQPLLKIVKSRKLKWFGHVTRHDSLSKTILQGTVSGGRKRGRPRKAWLNNIKEWTNLELPELLTTTQQRNEWRIISLSPSGTPTVNQTRG